MTKTQSIHQMLKECALQGRCMICAVYLKSITANFDFSLLLACRLCAVQLYRQRGVRGGVPGQVPGDWARVCDQEVQQRGCQGPAAVPRRAGLSRQSPPNGISRYRTMRFIGEQMAKLQGWAAKRRFRNAYAHFLAPRILLTRASRIHVYS